MKRVDSAQWQSVRAPSHDRSMSSRPQHATDRSKNRPTSQPNGRDYAESKIVNSAKPQHLSNGLTNGFSLKTGKLDPNVLSQQPGPFKLPEGRPPFGLKNPKSIIASISELASMRDGRPKPNQKLANKLQDYQGLSKNQIRRMKKKQRRLLDKE